MSGCVVPSLSLDCVLVAGEGNEREEKKWVKEEEAKMEENGSTYDEENEWGKMGKPEKDKKQDQLCYVFSILNIFLLGGTKSFLWVVACPVCRLALFCFCLVAVSGICTVKVCTLYICFWWPVVQRRWNSTPFQDSNDGEGQLVGARDDIPGAPWKPPWSLSCWWSCEIIVLISIRSDFLSALLRCFGWFLAWKI